MDFKKATNLLFSGPQHAELAKALGVSVASIRQARLPADAKAYRAPPKGWERGVRELAKAHVTQYQKLIDQLEQTEGPILGVQYLTRTAK